MLTVLGYSMVIVFMALIMTETHDGLDRADCGAGRICATRWLHEIGTMALAGTLVIIRGNSPKF